MVPGEVVAGAEEVLFDGVEDQACSMVAGDEWVAPVG